MLKTRELLPELDIEKLVETYDSTEHRGLDISTEEFLRNIEWRLYTEHCLNSNWASHQYQFVPGVWLQYIQDETHYALESSGYEWEPKGEKFVGLTQVEYNTIRDKVLEAFVKHAIDVFTKWGGECHGEGNLRGSLASYLQGN